MHALIFWGFLVITLGTIEMLGRGLVARLFGIPFLERHRPFQFALDAFQLFVLVGIAMALYRRIVSKPWYLNLSGDAIIILSLITTLMVTAFLAEGFLIACSTQPGDAALCGAVPGTEWASSATPWRGHSSSLSPSAASPCTAPSGGCTSSRCSASWPTCPTRSTCTS